jgi:hypothetical protein
MIKDMKWNQGDTVGLIISTIIILMFAFMSKANAMDNDWGKTGHRIIGEIAERQLSDDVKDIVYDILDGESLAVVSTWADEMRSNPSFDKFSHWHYVNLPLDKEYPEVKHTKANVVTIIERCVAILKSPSSDKEMKKFYLKYLVHLVGDLHQPMHTGRYEDYGGSKIYLTFKGRKGSDNKTNLHVLWDTNLIDDFKMSYTEWSNHLQNKYRKEVVKQSNTLEWTFESHWWARDIYKNTPEGSYLSYDYVYKYQPVLEKRLYYAGVRLGNLIQDIFGNIK